MIEQNNIKGEHSCIKQSVIFKLVVYLLQFRLEVLKRSFARDESPIYEVVVLTYAIGYIIK